MGFVRREKQCDAFSQLELATLLLPDIRVALQYRERPAQSPARLLVTPSLSNHSFDAMNESR